MGAIPFGRGGHKGQSARQAGRIAAEGGLRV
jgi:hypothetical protein